MGHHTILCLGVRKFNLGKLLNSKEDIHSSLFHFLVWKGNMGIVEHAVFKQVLLQLTQCFLKCLQNFGILSLCERF